jgi:four helix bundle protein
MKTHKDLDAWKVSIEMVIEVYTETKNFPKEELYSLVSQIRRSAVSVPSNIAEGAARKSKKEFIQYLHISLGSLAELETQIIISTKLGYLKGDELLATILDIRKLISGLLRYLKNSD